MQGPTRTSSTWDILRTGVLPATRILKHPLFVANAGCTSTTTSGFLTPYLRLTQLQQLSNSALSSQSFPNSKLLKSLLFDIDCLLVVGPRCCILRLLSLPDWSDTRNTCVTNPTIRRPTRHNILCLRVNLRTTSLAEQTTFLKDSKVSFPICRQLDLL